VSEVATAFREAHGKAVATLVRVFCDISLAEDAVQDAFVRALDTWPRDGVPGGLDRHNRAPPRCRSGPTRGSRPRADGAEGVDDSRFDDAPAAGVDMSRIQDDQLRLVFTC
jgi:RNA polymerase sigma-70 factor (ECF subfamily)